MCTKSSIPKVSVIIPIYNVEKFLPIAIESVVNQSLYDIEILLIDDGSTDESGNICDSWVTKDSRIRVIHKENEGLGRAIDTGIKESKGEYIGIVEADDRVSSEMYAKMYARAKEYQTDILKCGYYCCENSEIRECTEFYTIADDNEVFDIRQKPMLLLKSAYWWPAIYSRKFLIDAQIENVYSPGASYQDFSWMVLTLSLAKRVSIIHQPFYYYNLDNPTASVKTTGEKAFYMIFHCSEAISILRKNGLFSTVKEEIGCHAFRTCLPRAIYIRSDLRDEYFRKFKDLIANLDQEERLRFKYLNKTERQFIRALRSDDNRLFYRLIDSKTVKNVKRIKSFIKRIPGVIIIRNLFK